MTLAPANLRSNSYLNKNLVTTEHSILTRQHFHNRILDLPPFQAVSSGAPRMWSSLNTATTSAFASSSSQVPPVTPSASTSLDTPGLGDLSQHQTFAKPGRLNNLARAIESEFWAGQSTTDSFHARSRDRANPSTYPTLSSQPPPACSAPECKPFYQSRSQTGY